MKTINDITLWEAQKIVQLEAGSIAEPICNKRDVRLWPAQQYLWIKNRLFEMLDKPFLYNNTNDVLSTPKRKYKLNFNVSSLSDKQKDFFLKLNADGLNSLEFILAGIASPIEGRWFHQKEMNLEEIANDILRAKFIESYAAAIHFLTLAKRSTHEYKIEQLRAKILGKPKPVELVETQTGMYITLD